MVELNDEVYAKLTKDANDNKQLVRIARIAAIVVIFLLFFFTWGKSMIDLDIQRRRIDLECQEAIIRAENNVKVREIESSGMKIEDYLKWLEIREGTR